MPFPRLAVKSLSPGGPPSWKGLFRLRRLLIAYRISLTSLPFDDNRISQYVTRLGRASTDQR